MSSSVADLTTRRIWVKFGAAWVRGGKARHGNRPQAGRRVVCSPAANKHDPVPSSSALVPRVLVVSFGRAYGHVSAWRQRVDNPKVQRLAPTVDFADLRSANVDLPCSLLPFVLPFKFQTPSLRARNPRNLQGWPHLYSTLSCSRVIISRRQTARFPAHPLASHIASRVDEHAKEHALEMKDIA